MQSLLEIFRDHHHVSKFLLHMLVGLLLAWLVRSVRRMFKKPVVDITPAETLSTHSIVELRYPRSYFFLMVPVTVFFMAITLLALTGCYISNNYSMWQEREWYALPALALFFLVVTISGYFMRCSVSAIGIDFPWTTGLPSLKGGGLVPWHDFVSINYNSTWKTISFKTSTRRFWVYSLALQSTECANYIAYCAANRITPAMQSYIERIKRGEPDRMLPY